MSVTIPVAVLGWPASLSDVQVRAVGATTAASGYTNSGVTEHARGDGELSDYKGSVTVQDDYTGTVQWIDDGSTPTDSAGEFFTPEMVEDIRTIAVDVAGLNGDAMRGTDSAYTGTPPTVGAIADQVWDEAAADHVTAGTFGLYMKRLLQWFINKRTVTATTQTLYDDDGTSEVYSQTLEDDDTTATRGAAS
jgi:hypothetical protein